MNEFKKLLFRNLPEQTTRVIDVVGISTVEELYSLMWAFPSISTLEHVDLAQLSNEAFTCSKLSETQVRSNLASGNFFQSHRNRFSLGAVSNERSEWSIGASVKLSDYGDQPGFVSEQLPDVRVGY